MNLVQLFATKLAAFKVNHGEFLKELECHVEFAGLKPVVRVFL